MNNGTHRWVIQVVFHLYAWLRIIEIVHVGRWCVNHHDSSCRRVQWSSRRVRAVISITCYCVSQLLVSLATEQYNTGAVETDNGALLVRFNHTTSSLWETLTLQYLAKYLVTCQYPVNTFHSQSSLFLSAGWYVSRAAWHTSLRVGSVLFILNFVTLMDITNLH